MVHHGALDGISLVTVTVAVLSYDIGRLLDRRRKKLVFGTGRFSAGGALRSR